MAEATEAAPWKKQRKKAAAIAEVRITEMQHLGLMPVQQQFIAAVVRERLPFHAAQDLMRSAYVLEAVRQCNGNKCAAARLIGLHRNTLERILKREWPA